MLFFVTVFRWQKYLIPIAIGLFFPHFVQILKYPFLPEFSLVSSPIAPIWKLEGIELSDSRERAVRESLQVLKAMGFLNLGFRKTRFQIFLSPKWIKSEYLSTSARNKVIISHHCWGANFSFVIHCVFYRVFILYYSSTDRSHPRPILADVAAYIDLFLAGSAPSR